MAVIRSVDGLSKIELRRGVLVGSRYSTAAPAKKTGAASLKGASIESTRTTVVMSFDSQLMDKTLLFQAIGNCSLPER